MNCPKCGSENAKVQDGLVLCRECGYAQPEPSTAEKLFWIAENESIDIWHTASKEIISVWRNGEEYKFIFKTLVEAINAAYEWARKQEEQNDN